MLRRRLPVDDDDLESLPGARPMPGAVDPVTGEARVKPKGAWKFAILAFIAMVVVLALKNRFPQPTLFQKLELTAAVQKAQADGRVLVIDFYGNWCPPCERMDKETWLDGGVEKWVAQHGLAVRVNTSGTTEAERAATEAFAVREVPTVVVVRDGREVGRMVGFVGPGELTAWLERQRTGAPEPTRVTDAASPSSPGTPQP